MSGWPSEWRAVSVTDDQEATTALNIQAREGWDLAQAVPEGDAVMLIFKRSMPLPGAGKARSNVLEAVS